MNSPPLRRPLPTLWNAFNLTGSPFWQDTLEDESPSRPISLFVGRVTELEQLLDVIRASSGGASRQAIAGHAGVGKTTLVKALKARARLDGFMTINDFVPVQSDDTAEALFGRVLSLVYDTILANRPMAAQNKAMQDAQLLVRAARIGTGGASLSILGLGVGLSRGVSLSAPRDMMLDGPRVLRDLMALVTSSDAHGLLLHINNLENLSDADAAKAAVILRDVRDTMLMHAGLHSVIVGTTDAVQAVVNTYAQVRTVFSTLSLNPLPVRDVHALLDARYRHMRLHTNRALIQPVERATIDALYTLFRGDLRGLLKALDDGVKPNIGLAGHVEGGHVRAIDAHDIRLTLQQRYADHLAAVPERRRVEQLTAWGVHKPASTHTQQSLGALWRVTQGAVSNALAYLLRHGYITALPRRRGQAVEYELSGVSRLIFG